MTGEPSPHRLGVICGLAAGAWLGAAEVPARLVIAGLSPFLISLGMVAGVFVARWSLPMALKGTAYVLADIRQRPHLIVWAILAGGLWAVANTLTVFAIKNVGLSIAFPLWNMNSLIGLVWGWLLFGELRGAGPRQRAKVIGGACAILAGTCLLSYASNQTAGSSRAAAMGILAALTAGVLWGAMYIPYRKAYISGMNPLSFVTVFTFGELAAVFLLTISLDGGMRRLITGLAIARPAMFWLFLGGFCWVVGDLFQQYAAKYLGIGRGIPLSNTNQLWGLAWGALVFGELSGRGPLIHGLIAAGSILTIAGAASISLAEPPADEQSAWKEAIVRECRRYGLNESELMASLQGVDLSKRESSQRSAWDFLAAIVAIGLFIWLGALARRQPAALHVGWMTALIAATLVALLAGGFALWRRTRFA